MPSIFSVDNDSGLIEEDVKGGGGEGEGKGAEGVGGNERGDKGGRRKERSLKGSEKSSSVGRQTPVNP